MKLYLVIVEDGKQPHQGKWYEVTDKKQEELIQWIKKETTQKN